MEKLIKLLNEYENVNDWYATYTTRGEDSKRELKSSYMFDEAQNIIQIYIISKSFGFIKRLVENDKIDYSKLVEYEFDKLERFIQRKHNALLMLLSIQDNPIEFLISVLK